MPWAYWLQLGAESPLLCFTFGVVAKASLPLLSRPPSHFKQRHGHAGLERAFESAKGKRAEG
eukprot:6178463-Amphidinium_carterae.1